MACPPGLRSVVEAFEAHATEVDSDVHGRQSDDVLARVRPGLEERGFRVETGKKRDEKIHVPVLFGLNGKVEKSFEADAYHPEHRIVVEVEAGRGVANNQFLKDLFQACMMWNVDYVAIAVANVYRSGTTASKDFERVCMFIETLYASSRLTLPLRAVLIVGY